MAKAIEREQLRKREANFQLIGRAKLNDFTYKIDEEAKYSDWIYNVLNLGVECGDNGTIYAEMMGGYGAERDNVVYAHGKKENDSGKMVDDFQNRFTIDWEDRLNEDLFEDIGDRCFITVGIEKDSNDKYFIKKFLSEYDAIEYIKEHLESDTVLNVKGQFEYSEYNENIQTKKKIQSVFLSKVENPEEFRATFTQLILVDKDSVGDIDKDKMIVPIDAYVIDYVGKPRVDGAKLDVKKSISFPKMFELGFDAEHPEKTAKLIKKLFKPEKDEIWSIAVEGIITKGGATLSASIDDLPDDIKDLIDWNILTEKEALEKCVGGGGSVESYVICNPKINRLGEDKIPSIAIDKDAYTVDDLLFFAVAIEEALDEASGEFDKPKAQQKEEVKKEKVEEKKEEEEEEEDESDDALDLEDLLADL